MNIILFAANENSEQLDNADKRTKHIREILKMSVGDQLFVGVINGKRGKAEILSDNSDGLKFSIQWEEEIPKLFPIHLIVGLSRPQTCRKILQECSSLGVESISFFQSEKGEPQYADSSLWKSDEWERLIITGTEQAFSTRTPKVVHFKSLEEAVKSLEGIKLKTALDLYEADTALSSLDIEAPIALAIGSERGWSADERNILRDHNFTMSHMGDRVLRTESACIAAVSSILSAGQLWEK